MPPQLHAPLDPFLGELGVAIWTTTPWTIPANLAVSVNPDLVYAVVEVGENNPTPFKYLIVAKDLVETLEATLETTLTIQASAMGRLLEHCTYKHPLYDRQSEIVIGGDYVTTDSGTYSFAVAVGSGGAPVYRLATVI